MRSLNLRFILAQFVFYVPTSFLTFLSFFNISGFVLNLSTGRLQSSSFLLNLLVATTGS